MDFSKDPQYKFSWQKMYHPRVGLDPPILGSMSKDNHLCHCDQTFPSELVSVRGRARVCVGERMYRDRCVTDMTDWLTDWLIDWLIDWFNSFIMSLSDTVK